MKLTIGMATYDDYDGVFFTAQAIKFYHSDVTKHCELVVVDNHPDSDYGHHTADFLGKSGGRYIPMPEPVGTTQGRNRVFAEATGDSVLCIDSHVLLVPGSINRLIEYYDGHPDTGDLLSGPMMYDNGVEYATHFNDEWRGEMWGTWGQSSLMSDEPMVIPGMGLGLFSCRRGAWLGFNQHFRGFGGEEMYIHEKYRQAGHQCLCLPWLGWVHRFGRPGGLPYVAHCTRFNKVRNYVLGLTELGLSLDRCHDHFVGGGLVTQEQWDWIVEDPINHSSLELHPDVLSPSCAE